MTSRYLIFDKHTLIDIFCSKLTSHRITHFRLCKSILVKQISDSIYLGDNCIVFENFTASIKDLMVAN